MPDLTIVQAPVSVSLICDRCCTELSAPYKEFCDEHGCPADWLELEIICPECGHCNQVDDWEWD